MRRSLVHVSCHTLTNVNRAGFPASPSANRLTVYNIRISGYETHLPYLTALLQPDEQSRAGRYHQPDDRQRFTVARGTLRLLLSRYTGQVPTRIRFGADRNKKPVLPDFPGLHYNVAHAGDRVLIAVADSPMGIDVEQVAADFTFKDVLQYAFSPQERMFIANSTDSRADFYRLWTRKEALVKATAKGLDADVARIPSLRGTHAVAAELIGSPDDWTVGSFVPDAGYVAAIACWEGVFARGPVVCELDHALLIPVDAPPY